MPIARTGHIPSTRRTFLIAGGLTFFGLNLAPAAPVAFQVGSRRIAKSTILIWLSGGASHIDTWDMKPDAPEQYRGLFRPIQTRAPGIELCEHLPHLGKQAHQLAVVRSLGDFGRGTGDHHAGYYYNLTGHAPDASFHRLLNARKPESSDWPSMASVVSFKRPPHPSLPSAITLPQKEGAPEYTRPGQFAARLGLEYDSLFVDGSRESPMKFGIPALKLQGDVTLEHLLAKRALLATIDDGQRRFENSLAVEAYNKHQQKAISLLTSQQTKDAFDLAAEPQSVRDHPFQAVTGHDSSGFPAGELTARMKWRCTAGCAVPKSRRPGHVVRHTHHAICRTSAHRHDGTWIDGEHSLARRVEHDFSRDSRAAA
jgi:hypothetical protein